MSLFSNSFYFELFLQELPHRTLLAQLLLAWTSASSHWQAGSGASATATHANTQLHKCEMGLVLFLRLTPGQMSLLLAWLTWNQDPKLRPNEEQPTDQINKCHK